MIGVMSSSTLDFAFKFTTNFALIAGQRWHALCRSGPGGTR